MLSSFTWQQYLMAAGAILGLYYLAVLLLCYRAELMHMLKGKANRAGLPADPPIPPQVSIMGPASPGAAPLLSEAAAILVAPQPPTEAPEGPEDAIVRAVLQEMSPLLELAAEADAEKEELLPLLRLVAARHSSSMEDHHRKAIEEFLLGQGRSSFTLTPADMHSLWNAAPSEQ
ncbi:hypothetical protein ACFS7Z_22565 [Pontibacter toksunensis]|uniref:Tellurite resistance protein TerB n=1 Tax=Pontibacter toksunensis TaxID=1332631 RepID=A0ABW6BZC5_9BACT